ncbi:MAG: sigma-70 family RNA polymerase sigma factor [Candidatus Anstonellales archaeon]
MQHNYRYRKKYFPKSKFSDDNIVLLRKIKNNNHDEKETQRLLYELFLLNKGIIDKTISSLNLEGSYLTREDFYGLAYITLFNCIKYYNENLGVTFSTYLTSALKNKFERELETNRSNINLPSNLNRKYKIAEHKLLSIGEALNEENLSRVTNLSLDISHSLLREKRIENARSIYEGILPSNSEPDENITVEEYLLIDHTQNVEQIVIEKETKELVHKILQELEKKDKKKADIIKLYFGLTKDRKEYNVYQIAVLMNLSRERVRQIMQKALLELKEMIEERQCYDTR